KLTRYVAASCSTLGIAVQPGPQRPLSGDATPATADRLWPTGDVAAAQLVVIKPQSARPFPKRHRPQCRGSGRYFPVLYARAAAARPVGSWCADRLTKPSYGAWSECRKPHHRGRSQQPIGERSSRTPGWKGAARHEHGLGTETHRDGGALRRSTRRLIDASDQ